MQLALKGSQRSHPTKASAGSCWGCRAWRASRRWEAAVWASGLISAHEYEAMWWPARSNASSPVAIPAQISTTCRGLLGVRYGRMCVSDGSCGQRSAGGGSRVFGEVGGVQLGVGVSPESGRVGGFSGGVVGCRAERGVGRSSMCWSGSAHNRRRAGTNIVCNLCMSSHFTRPVLLATTTKSTGHLAGLRRSGLVAVSGELSAGAKRIWEGPREVRISTLSCARMSADLQGVSSHLGRTRGHRNGYG